MDIELIQFSAEWCGPCRMLRKQIEEKYDVEELNWKWIDVDDIGKAEPKYQSLYAFLKVKSVPTLVTLKGEEIIGTVAGANLRFVDQYKKFKDTEESITDLEVCDYEPDESEDIQPEA